MESEDEQEARISLLEWYRSECMQHGTYILTSGLVALALIEAITASHLNFLYLIIGIAFLSAIAGYFLIRILYWANLANAILWTVPQSEERFRNTHRWTSGYAVKETLMYRLHMQCVDDMKRAHRLNRLFSRTKD